MQLSSVLTVVVGVMRARTQLSLTNFLTYCATLLPRHLELTVTTVKTGAVVNSNNMGICIQPFGDMPIRHRYRDNIFKFLSRSLHFSTPHDAEHVNLTIGRGAYRKVEEHGECGARPYNGVLGAKLPAGSRGRAPGQRVRGEALLKLKSFQR